MVGNWFREKYLEKKEEEEEEKEEDG